MTVNTVTGEVTPDLTRGEAQALTDRIRDSVQQAWSLLLEAHERRAWAALGYDRWEDYIGAEFAMGRRRSYQLLDQGRVIREVAAACRPRATPETVDDPEPCEQMFTPEITEAEARDIKPVLPLVVEAIRERTADATPEQVPGIVRSIVREHRTPVHNPIAAAKAEAAARPGIIAGKAIERLRLTRLTFEAAGDGATVMADVLASPLGGWGVDLWLDELDQSITVLQDQAAAIRRARIRSAP